MYLKEKVGMNMFYGCQPDVKLMKGFVLFYALLIMWFDKLTSAGLKMS